MMITLISRCFRSRLYEWLYSPIEDRIGESIMAPISWADLPPDLIESISNRLGLIDLLSFRGVCQNWNLASFTSSAEIESTSCCEPWFLLYGENSQCSLLSGNDKKYKINILELNGATCIASKEGWLLVHREGSLFFFCPFSRAKIELPQFPYSELKDHVAAFSSAPTCKDCIVCVVCQNDEMDVLLYTLSHGAVAWTMHKYTHTRTCFKSVKAATYVDKTFYFLDDTNQVIKFSPEEDVKWARRQIVDHHSECREFLPFFIKRSCFEEKSIIEKLGLKNDVWITSCGTIVPTGKYPKLFFNESINKTQESESCCHKGVWLTPRFYQISPVLRW
ncbi:hypothetical protein ACOSQ3_001658 [Xanthoceras sorbifolium]